MWVAVCRPNGDDDADAVAAAVVVLIDDGGNLAVAVTGR